MKIVRYVYADAVRYGVLEGKRIREVEGDPFAGHLVQGKAVSRDRVRLLAPCVPSKIVAVGLNYRDHAEEVGFEIPEEPLLFLKPSTAALEPEGAILLPPQSGRVDYEAELGIVIGKEARGVPVHEAQEYILGYTCFNDVTARDLQARDVQYTRAKGFDTFAPFGPWIVTDLDTTDLRIELFQNGEKRQSSTTGHLVFSPPELIAYISGIMTLVPGDVIATGTPAGVGPMQAGDVIEVIVEGIGTLKNTVRSREDEEKAE